MKAIQQGTFNIDYEALYLELKKECIPLFEIESIKLKPISTGRDESDVESRSDTSLVEDDSNLEEVVIKGYGTYTMEQIVLDIKEKLSEFKSNGIKNVKAIILDQESALVGGFMGAKTRVKDYEYGLVVIFYYNLGSGNQVFYYVHDPLNLESPLIPGTDNSSGSGTGEIELSGLDSSILIMEVPISLKKKVNYNLGVNSTLAYFTGAIGYSVSAGGEFTGVTGAGISGGVQRIMFTYGPYAYYPYTYVFHETTVTAGWNPGTISAAIEVVFAGYVGDSIGSYRPNPIDYQGNYNVIFGYDISAAEIVEVGITLQLNYWDTSDNSLPDNNRWLSFTAGPTIGASLVPGVNFSFRSTAFRNWSQSENPPPLASCTLISKNPKPTAERNIWDQSIAWLRFFGIAPDFELFGALGEAILNLIKKVI
jgi:hypothetical protein